MRLRSPSILVLVLVSTSFTRGEDPEDLSSSEEEKPVQESFEEVSNADEFPAETSTESTATAEAYGKLTLSISDEKNASADFRPSVHLGEIKEPRISSSPFNNLQHIRFENDIDSSSYGEQLKDYKLVLEPTVQSVLADHQASFQQSLPETVPPEEGKKDAVEQNSYVKFQDDAANAPRLHYGTVFKDQPFHLPFAQSIAENEAAQHGPIDQQVFQNLEKPVYQQDANVFWGKPSKFQGDSQKHELGGFSVLDPTRSQYFGGLYGHQSQQPTVHSFDASGRPSNGLVYVQESTFMSTRKFPYSFYQPSIGYHQANFLGDDHSMYAARKRVSPWKKILHLIGAFLPLGLLLAALTPSTVKVDNTTQPGIVLSKWRAGDLPAEHKQARLAEEPSNVCEERFICEQILVGGRAESSVLQNLLWNLATRTSTAVAKQSDLHEVFEAVKKKDCSMLAC
ncbi:uncharacterized protein LOC143376574 [Andrena cerasifolii]|uniref:uncharacterized protein LOC143376574 n=1 Tax=Andrena cerasifolii TaxID=2819439 RepID=UPI00403836B9